MGNRIARKCERNERKWRNRAEQRRRAKRNKELMARPMWQASPSFLK